MSSTDRSGPSLWVYASSSLALVLLAGLILRLFVVTPLLVTGTAMAPALLSHDFVLSWRNAPLVRGEIVVYACQSGGQASCARRLVGIPGDRVEMKGGELLLNGEEAQYEPMGSDGFTVETWREMKQVVVKSKTDVPPLVVPPGQVFLLDDNRSQNLEVGALTSQDSIEGRAWRIWLSLDWFENGKLRSWPKIRWERLFREVD